MSSDFVHVSLYVCRPAYLFVFNLILIQHEFLVCNFNVLNDAFVIFSDFILLDKLQKGADLVWLPTRKELGRHDYVCLGHFGAYPNE